MERRKRYSRKFQRMAVERMRTCESIEGLAKELGVTRRCPYKWRTKLEAAEPGEEAARPSTHASAHRKEILQLKRLLAEKAMEVDLALLQPRRSPVQARSTASVDAKSLGKSRRHGDPEDRLARCQEVRPRCEYQ